MAGDVPRLRKRRWMILLAGLMLTLAAGLSTFILRNVEEPSLRADMAKALAVDEAQIELNIPPFPNRYPGALILEAAPGQNILLRAGVRGDEPPVSLDTLKGGFGDALTTEMGASGKPASAVGKFDLDARSSSDSETSFLVSKVRIFEMPLPQLKASLSGDADTLREVQRQTRAGRAVHIVDRAFEGKLEVLLKRKANGSADGWLKLKDNALRSGATVIDNGTLAMAVSAPVVFAYHTLDASVVATSLGAGGLDVELNARPREVVQSTFPRPSSFGLTSSTADVAYWLTGTAQYQNDAFGYPRAVGPSLGLVDSVLSALGATAVGPTADPKLQTTRASLLRGLDEAAAQAKVKGLSTLIIYYVGHAVSVDNGQVYLVGSDYSRDVKADIGVQRMFGLSRFQLDQPHSPLAGSNINDLLNVVTAANGQFADVIPGMTAVSELAQRPSLHDLRVVLLIDSCFDSDQMKDLRNALYLMPNGDYAGPGEQLPVGVLDAYRRALSQFSQAPYLRSNNPIIFASAPGFLAREQPMPAVYWPPEATVGPLAAELYGDYAHALQNGETLTLGEFLTRLVDIRPMGEFAVSGTISWSDFSGLQSQPMLVKKERDDGGQH